MLVDAGDEDQAIVDFMTSCISGPQLERRILSDTPCADSLEWMSKTSVANIRAYREQKITDIETVARSLHFNMSVDKWYKRCCKGASSEVNGPLFIILVKTRAHGP